MLAILAEEVSERIGGVPVVVGIVTVVVGAIVVVSIIIQERSAKRKAKSLEAPLAAPRHTEPSTEQIRSMGERAIREAQQGSKPAHHSGRSHYESVNEARDRIVRGGDTHSGYRHASPTPQRHSYDTDTGALGPSYPGLTPLDPARDNTGYATTDSDRGDSPGNYDNRPDPSPSYEPPHSDTGGSTNSGGGSDYSGGGSSSSYDSSSSSSDTGGGGY